MPVAILVLYDHKGPGIEALALAVAQGVSSSGVGIVTIKKTHEADRGDLIRADGLLLGSPNWSGITGSLKQWLDDQGDLWEERALAGRPAAAFTSGWGRHSGMEMTLLQVVHWMLACGMIVVGLPWSDRMRHSGSYYGATTTGGVTDDDLAQARELGARLTMITARLKPY